MALEQKQKIRALKQKYDPVFEEKSVSLLLCKLLSLHILRIARIG
jgi:hypothetical protein